MLETFTADTFTPRVGETFRFVVDEEWEMRARLTSVTPWGDETARARGRQPFTLLFHAPRESQVPQSIYRVENENMEPFELFLVPVGADGEGMRYEAVFT